MIHDDYNFIHDDSTFPVSIEEFAAYLDGNLTDDEMQRVSSMVDEDNDLQEIRDTCNSIDELYDYNEFVGDTIIPDEIKRMEFDIPNLDTINIYDPPVDSPWGADVAACAEEPTDIDLSVYENESSYNSGTLKVPEYNDVLPSDGDADLDLPSSSDTDIDISFLDN